MAAARNRLQTYRRVEQRSNRQKVRLSSHFLLIQDNSRYLELISSSESNYCLFLKGQKKNDRDFQNSGVRLSDELHDFSHVSNIVKLNSVLIRRSFCWTPPEFVPLEDEGRIQSPKRQVLKKDSRSKKSKAIPVTDLGGL
jgi:hypothetical protein